LPGAGRLSIGQRQSRPFGVATEECRGGAQLLDALCPGPLTEGCDHLPTLFTSRRGEPDLDQFMVIERLFEFLDHGIGEPALAEAYNGLAAMGLSPEETDLGTAEHREDRSSESGGSLARDADAALASIKRELAAILVVALIGAPLVIYWLEGARELAVLGAYGVGAGLWVHTRARGLLLALRQARRAGRQHGP